MHLKTVCLVVVPFRESSSEATLEQQRQEGCTENTKHNCTSLLGQLATGRQPRFSANASRSTNNGGYRLSVNGLFYANAYTDVLRILEETT